MNRDHFARPTSGMWSCLTTAGALGSDELSNPPHRRTPNAQPDHVRSRRCRSRLGRDRLSTLAVPQAFHAITASAFPKDTTTWTKRNGVTEAVVGTAIAIPATRKAGLVALGAYVAFLGSRIVLARR